MSDGLNFRQRRLKSWWLVIWCTCVILARDSWQSLITSRKLTKDLTEYVISGFRLLVFFWFPLSGFSASFPLCLAERWLWVSLCSWICAVHGLALQRCSLCVFCSSLFFFNWWTCSNTLASLRSGAGISCPIHRLTHSPCWEYWLLLSLSLPLTFSLFNWCLRYFSDS